MLRCFNEVFTVCLYDIVDMDDEYGTVVAQQLEYVIWQSKLKAEAAESAGCV